MKYIASVFICITMANTSIFSAPPATQRKQPSRFCNAPKDKPHLSSYPYISGDTFRSYANFIIEDYDDHLDTTQIKAGDIIFVQTDYLQHFFTDIHPSITTPYILITHNSDDPAPGSYDKHLEDSTLIAWFGQNPSIAHHSKFIPIPIGIANKSFDYGNTAILDAIITPELYAQTNLRNHLLYMNFTISTNIPERKKAYDAVINASFCTYEIRIPYERYIHNLIGFRYIISPEGNGLDCYRTWEAMLLGCIPIVKHSNLDPLFDRLPILLIHDWNEITEEFLMKKNIEINKKVYHYEELYIEHWISIIQRYRDPYL